MAKSKANDNRAIMDFYRKYIDILGRCYMPDHPRFPEEGAKGIEVCKEWQKSFWTFFGDLVETYPEVKKLKMQMSKNMHR